MLYFQTSEVNCSCRKCKNQWTVLVPVTNHDIDEVITICDKCDDHLPTWI